MASFHLYSSTPSASDLAAVASALAKADSAHEKNAREAAYIDAFHLLYDGSAVAVLAHARDAA